MNDRRLSLVVALCVVMATLLGCGATEESKTASSCVEQTRGLCPPGTSPDISAQALNSCSGDGSVDIINQDGDISGRA